MVVDCQRKRLKDVTDVISNRFLTSKKETCDIAEGQKKTKKQRDPLTDTRMAFGRKVVLAPLPTLLPLQFSRAAGRNKENKRSEDGEVKPSTTSTRTPVAVVD